MTSLKENLQAIVDQDFPNELHGRIMNSVVFIRRFRIFCWTAAAFCGIALVSSAEYLGKMLLENEFFTVCQVLLGGLQSDYDVIKASLEAIIFSLPFQATLTFAITLVLAVAVFIGLRKFNMSAYYLNKIYLKVE